MKILYVEDHAIFAGMVCKGFLAGHAVTVVPSLARARAALEGERFDVLLVDYDLEDGKGASLVRELRARGDVTPIVAVSSHAEGNGELSRAGADRVCAKRNMDRLAGLLEELGVAAPSAKPTGLEPPLWTPEQPLRQAPLRFECATRADAPSAEELEERVDWAHRGVIVFAEQSDALPHASELRPQLPEHSVFLSGGSQLTVSRVLPVGHVLARADDLLLALQNFRSLATALARRLTRPLHVSLRSLSTREIRHREGIPSSGEVNRIWSYGFHGHELAFRSRGGLVLDVLLGFEEEFGRLDTGFVLAFLRGPFDPVEVSGVVRDDPAAVERVLRGANVHPQLRALLLDSHTQTSRALEVLEAAGYLEVASGEGGRQALRIAE